MAREPYAVRTSGGEKKYYMTRKDYLAGRGQARATAAAQRARINKAIGGNVV